MKKTFLSLVLLYFISNTIPRSLRLSLKLTLFYFLLISSTNCFSSSYTWNGNISTNWNDTSNWTPHGIPSSTDSITVVSGSNNINLSANTTVSQIKMNSGTIDLQSYILTANGDCQFVSGTIQNGKIVISGSITAKFKGTTFNAVVHVNANSVLLNGSVFNDSLTIIKNGSSGDLGKGGNTFYGVTSIENNGSGSLVLSDSLPDTFNSTLEVNNASSGNIYLAHRGAGNIFNGKVTLKGSKIYSNYYGSANYNEDITLDTRSGEVYFGYASGSCTLIDGKTITVSSGGITSGVVYFRNFILQDTSKALALNLSGTSQLYFENGCEIYADVNCSAPIVLLNGAHFYRSAIFTNTGTIESTSVGGNYFGGLTTIKNNCSTPMVLTTGSTRTDTFANKAILENVSGIVSVNNAYFADSVTLKNQNTSNSAVKFYISYSGNCFFKRPVTIDNNTSGMEFSKSGVNATTTLDTAATFIFKTGFSGNLSFKNVITLGNTAHVFDFPSSNSKLILGPGSTFGGNVSFYGQSMSLNGTKFNGNAELIKYGNASDTSKGSNEFNGTTTIIDSSSSGNLILAYNSADDFNGNVTFIQKGTNAKLYPAYNYNTTFSGSISIDGSSAINFSRSGKVIFDGSTAQSINNSSSYAPIFGKIAMNKSNNSLTLNTPLTVTDSLLFLKGNISADTTNYISLNNTGKIAGASDSSLVNGPFKKIGNNAFVFPVGFNGLHGYHPVEITAPSSSTDSYTGQFIHQGQTLGNATDTTIDFLNNCEYWKVTKNTGTSKVRVKLNWNYDSCNIINPEYMRIAGWNGSVWKDLKSYSYSGDSLKGSSITLDSIAATTELTLAQKRCIYFSQEVTKHDVYCKGNNDGVAYAQVHGGHPPIKYQWSNGMGTQPASAAILYPGQFTITTTDAAYCELKDTILINEPEILSLSYSVTPSHCGDSSGVVSLTANGGTGIIKKVYWTNDGSTGFYHEHLASGKYNVLLTDSSGCSVFTEIPVHDDDGPAISVSSLTSLTCFEGSDGAALIEVSGNDPFHYHWSSSDDDTLSEITGKRAGLYSVQVTDENGCISFDTIEITQPDTFQVHVTTENTRCGQGMGRALATVSGGTGDYHYIWSNGGNDYYEIDGLNSGRDSLTVTDDLGCTASTNFEILDIDGITITGNIISHGICFPDSGGTANVIVTNGTAPYTYSWFPQGGDQDTVFNLPPDKYTVTVVDANGCRQQTELIIASPDELKLYFDVTSPSTDSSSDGSISSIVYGGTPPYSYQWSNNSSADAIYGLPLEIDTLKVTDHNGCSVRASTGTGGGHNNSCTKFHSKQLPSTCNTFPNICSSPCNSVMVSINQFGALGNGIANDQCAFESASAFFRSLAPSVSKTLIIPIGTYIVGRQETYNSYYLWGNSVLCFDDIENLTIQGSGANGTILKFEDCMKYGSFDWPTHPTHRLLQCPPCYSDIDYSHVAFPGIMIRINNGKNIKIKDLTLDGNLDNIKIGGAFPNGVSYDGIFLNASFNVTIENLIAKNFGHDGIYIIFDYCPAGFPPLDKNAILNTDMNCVINKVKCLYNGRNGLSWGGGNGLHIIDSEFNWSGQGKLTLTPASGIDIEYENSNVKNSNGIFENVNFKYNKFWGMTCNAGEPDSTGATTDYFSQNFTFIKSNFVSSENGINAIPNSRKFDFKRCVFVGQIQKAFYSIWSPYHLGPGGVIVTNPNSNTNTKFEQKCSFLEHYTDPSINPLTKKYFAPQHEEPCPACASQCPVPIHQPAIDFDHSMGVIFDDCTIETYFTLKWIRLSPHWQTTLISSNSWNTIKNCEFKSHGINMCACDYNLADFFLTNFQKPISYAYGMNGLNNQRIFPTLCATSPSNNWNTFNFGNSINTFNFEGNVPGSPLEVKHTYLWKSISDQLLLNLLPPKFKDPIVPNKVTDFYSCPQCSESTPAGTGILASCVNSPRLKRETDISDEIGLTVSPNPSTEFLLVENAGDRQNIKIINLVGKVEIQNELYYGVQKIDISKLPAGLYLLITENNQSYKFIKM